MRKRGHRKTWVMFGISIVTVAILVGLAERFGSNDPREITETKVVDAPKTIRSVVSRQVDFDQTEWKELVGLENSTIQLGPNQLEWSAGGRGIGYLYFWQYRRTGDFVWEFAPCSKRELEEVVQSDVEGEFFNFDSTNRWETFGYRMRTNSVVVFDGEIVLARHKDHTSIVYAVKVDEQDSNGAQTRFKRLER